MLLSPLAIISLIPEQIPSTTTRTGMVNEYSFKYSSPNHEVFKRTTHDLGLYILEKICKLTDEFPLDKSIKYQVRSFFNRLRIPDL